MLLEKDKILILTCGSYDEWCILCRGRLKRDYSLNPSLYHFAVRDIIEFLNAIEILEDDKTGDLKSLVSPTRHTRIVCKFDYEIWISDMEINFAPIHEKMKYLLMPIESKLS